MTSIAHALVCVQRDFPQMLSAARIEPLCAQVGHHFRQRVLDPVALLRVMILEVLATRKARKGSCPALSQPS